MSITGDQVNFTAVAKRGVTLHNFPQVLAADLADAANIVNDAAQSGKRLGAQIMVVDDYDTVAAAAIYVATDSGSVSPWVVVKIVLGTGQVDVTPA